MKWFKASSPRRPIEPLDEWRCVGRTVRDRKPLDDHDLIKPAVQVAAIAAPLAISLYGGSLAVLAKDAIIIVDEEAGTGVPGCGFTNLLRHPEKRRVACGVHMDDPSRVDLHDDEDIGDREEGSVLGEEVTCPKLLAVVADERAPGLVPTRRRAAREHVPADRAGRVFDPKLGGKFLCDLVFTPLGVVARYTLNEVNIHAWNAGTTDPARAPFAAPHCPEAVAVPTEYGGRFDDDERAGPVWPESAEDDPESTITGTESGTFLSP